MTDQPNPLREQLLALRRKVRREVRDAKVRQGLVNPRSLREIPLWRAGVAERFGLDDQDHAIDPPDRSTEATQTARRPRDITEGPSTRKRRHQPPATEPADHPPDAA